MGIKNSMHQQEIIEVNRIDKPFCRIDILNYIKFANENNVYKLKYHALLKSNSYHLFQESQVKRVSRVKDLSLYHDSKVYLV